MSEALCYDIRSFIIVLQHGECEDMPDQDTIYGQSENRSFDNYGKCGDKTLFGCVMHVHVRE